ncbi:MAG: TetR/AcrR family transcriptional regulator [Bacteroidota bacterium]
MGKAEETRQAIIEQAAILFNKKGYAATSIPEITSAKGVTKGSFYGNFKNKEQIELAAFDYNIKLMNITLRNKIKKRDNAIDKLLVFEDYYYDLIKNGKYPAGCAILNTAIEADDTHPKLNKRVIAAIENWKNSIIGIIDKGKKYEQIKLEINAEEYALFFIAMIEGAIMLAKTYKSLDPLKKVMKHYRRVILQELKV